MSSLLSSFGWLTAARPASTLRRESEADLQPIRRAMLEALGTRVAQPHTILAPRILHAVDADRLWQLRGELMQALAAAHGERHARQELQRISALFRDLLPAGLASGLAAPRRDH